jgi:protein O-mannosyl-transferase
VNQEKRLNQRKTLWFVIALAVVTLLAYLPAMNAGFIWDDDDYVINNETLRDLSGLWQIWTNPRATPQYYPFVHSTFWLEYQTWGLAAPGYHVVNVLIHFANAMLLWQLCRRLEIPAAWLIGLVFAIHPVHVESVAWITERTSCQDSSI